MSMIYKSLKQARNQGQERSSKARFFNPSAADPNQRRVIKRFALYILLVIVFLWGAVFLLQNEMQRIAGMINQRVHVDTVFHDGGSVDPHQQARDDMNETAYDEYYDEYEEHDPWAQEEDDMEQSEVVVSEVRPALSIAPRTAPMTGSSPAHEPRSSQSLPFVAARTTPVANASTPPPPEPEAGVLDQELERHFSAQILRNNELLALERQTVHLGKSPLELADAMEQRLGPQSMHALRLRGYDALKAGDYARAETIFRESLARTPRDKTTRMNLVLALMGQDKQQEARQVHDDLARDFPLDDDVTKLRSIFQ